MSNFKVSQLPASTEVAVEDILPIVDVSEGLTKKTTAGDLIDLAANTIDSMPNLIVDPENNFTNFSQAVRAEIIAGDGITYTAETGEVKLTSKSITINSTVVNLGDSISIPSGPTYTAGTGINIVGNQIINTAPGTSATSLTSGGTFPSNLTFSPSTGNITAVLNSNPTLRSITVTKNSTGDSEQTATSYAASFQSTIAQSALIVEASSSNSAIPAVLITNTGIGNSFEVRDQVGDTSPFQIKANGAVSMGAGATITTGSLFVASTPDVAPFNTPADGSGLVLSRGLNVHGGYANLSINGLSGSSGFTRTLVGTDNLLVGLSAGTITLPQIVNGLVVATGQEYIIKKFNGLNITILTSGTDLFLDNADNSLLLNTTGKNETVTIRACSFPGWPINVWVIVHYTAINGPTVGPGTGFLAVVP